MTLGNWIRGVLSLPVAILFGSGYSATGGSFLIKYLFFCFLLRNLRQWPITTSLKSINKSTALFGSNSKFLFQYRDVKCLHISFENRFVREQRHQKNQVSLYMHHTTFLNVIIFNYYINISIKTEKEQTSAYLLKLLFKQ